MIIAGFGFRGGASVESLADAYRRAARASRQSAAVIATVEDKARSDAFVALSRSLGLPVQTVTSEALRSQRTATQSSAAMAARATGSVAEAACLAAAGPASTLRVARCISKDRMATCAFAEARQ